jgi:predicted nucleic acid-binding protein
MKLMDVNQWVCAFRSDSPFHEKARESINSCLQRREPFLFSPGIASSFLRLVTNPKIFKEPSTIEEARYRTPGLQRSRSGMTPGSLQLIVDTQSIKD